jgi:hypothetical protein
MKILKTTKAHPIETKDSDRRNRKIRTGPRMPTGGTFQKWDHPQAMPKTQRDQLKLNNKRKPK